MRQSYCVNHLYVVQCCKVIVYVIKLGFCINFVCQGGRVFAFSWLVCMSAVSHKSFPWMSTKLLWGTCHETRNNRLDHWVMWFWIWEFFFTLFNIAVRVCWFSRWHHFTYVVYYNCDQAWQRFVLCGCFLVLIYVVIDVIWWFNVVLILMCRNVHVLVIVYCISTHTMLISLLQLSIS